MENRAIPVLAASIQSPPCRVEYPIAIPIPDEHFQEEEGVLWQNTEVVAVHGRNADTISSFLFDLIREGITCTSTLSGGSSQGISCHGTISYCIENIDQAFYVQESSGRTPLHEACLRGACIHVIKALLNANPIGALEPDHAGNYPLHLLFVDFSYQIVNREDMEDIIHALLEVDPSHLATVVNEDGATPLHIACTEAAKTAVNNSIISKLLESNPSCAENLNNRLETALHLYCAGNNASCDVAKILLDANPNSLFQGNWRGMNPLHLAARARNIELVRFFLREKPEAARLSAHDGKTALHFLCSQRAEEAQLPAIQDFIQVAPEVLTMIDSTRKQNPLSIVCALQRPYGPVIRLLATSNAASMIDDEHYTALHHACEMYADVEIIKILLSVNNMAAFKVNKKHNTALHIACEQNTCSNMVRLLVEVNKDALKMSNNYGFIPLHCVCRAYQPRIEIVRTLLESWPSSVSQRTNGGETAIHLACSSGASVCVLNLLSSVQNKMNNDILGSSPNPILSIATYTTNKIGNSPLHEACFRGSTFEHILTLAKATPEWITLRNTAGYTPLQIMCKSGCLDKHVVTAFSQIRGSEVFSVVDPTGHTPLHSACREGTSLAAIRSLIREYPEALDSKTRYGDTPLHLSCLRRAAVEFVSEIAISNKNSQMANSLVTNTAGQTPIGIAMDEFYHICIKDRKNSRCDDCCLKMKYTPPQNRAFNVLARLVKLLYYGYPIGNDISSSLVIASVSLHQQEVRLDPAFIRRAISLHPEEVGRMDTDGNYPLHIEASIPVEKMSLLDGPQRECCEGKCHSRSGIIGNLLSEYPDATQVRNVANEFPIGLMIQSGRCWDQIFSIALCHSPPALHWYKLRGDTLTPYILSRVSKKCGFETLYQLINSKPEIVRKLHLLKSAQS